MYYDQPITKGTWMHGFAHFSGSFETLDADEPYPGVTRRSFSSERATVTSYRFEPGASFPRHSHPQEQITIVERGEVRFTVGESVEELRAGGWSVVPADVEHGLEATGEGAEILAVIVPPRRHADAYSVIAGSGTAA
jgi:quercetin dioxygenase-like cupin family protein